MLQTVRTQMTAKQPAPWQAPLQNKAALDLAGLEEGGIRTLINRGDEIYAEGEANEHCYRLLSGCVRLVKLMSDGRRQVCEFLVAGDMFGLEDADEHFFSAEAVADCVVVRYPRRHIESLIATRPAFASYVRKLSSTVLRDAYERMVMLCHKSAQERVAWFLLDMEERAATDKTGALTLPMNRTDIADYLGMALETVSRAFTQLRNGKIIDTENASRVFIRDRAALEDMRGEA